MEFEVVCYFRRIGAVGVSHVDMFVSSTQALQTRSYPAVRPSDAIVS